MKNFVMSLFVVTLMGISSVHAHEMTPTYPELKISHLDGVLKATMQMFNKRNDVDYYEIAVLDSEFKPIPFVTSYRIIKIEYLGHVSFDVYIRKVDEDRAAYVCSRSRLRKDTSVRTAIASTICSKFKK